jgi:hypothetical protein
MTFASEKRKRLKKDILILTPSASGRVDKERLKQSVKIPKQLRMLGTDYGT